MKIKRYMAASMREALALVRDEQGSDAVILSSRRVDDGIEVIAAVDYDEALFSDARQLRIVAPEPVAPRAVSPQPPGLSMPREAFVSPVAVLAIAAGATAVAGATVVAGTRAAGGAPAAAVAAASPASGAPATDGAFVAMQRELKDLRSMIEGEFNHMSWNDKRLREPLQARVLQDLSAMDIAPDVAMELATLTPIRTSLEDPAHIPLAMLVRHLPVVDNLTTVNPGIIAVVGPTGAGKTTTIAKLAACWSMQHGCEDLALVSTDSLRIGAREQLASYARIIGAPMHTANNGKELAQVLERLKSRKLILIDTAGMGPRDVRLSEQLAALELGAARAKVLLALPAHGEANALEEIVRSFKRVSPEACILTKVDEAASLGAVLSVTLRHKLKIAYLCNGQRVPEDLHPAHQQKVWLARTALNFKKTVAARVDEGYMAQHFGGTSAHA